MSLDSLIPQIQTGTLLALRAWTERISDRVLSRSDLVRPPDARASLDQSRAPKRDRSLSLSRAARRGSSHGSHRSPAFVRSAFRPASRYTLAASCADTRLCEPDLLRSRARCPCARPQENPPVDTLPGRRLLLVRPDVQSAHCSAGNSTPVPERCSPDPTRRSGQCACVSRV